MDGGEHGHSSVGWNLGETTGCSVKDACSDGVIFWLQCWYGALKSYIGNRSCGTVFGEFCGVCGGAAGDAPEVVAVSMWQGKHRCRRGSGVGRVVSEAFNVTRCSMQIVRDVGSLSNLEESGCGFKSYQSIFRRVV